MSDIEQAYIALKPYVPVNATLTIEETDGRMTAKYLLRMQYRSVRSGKSFSITARGETLPKANSELIRHYTSQLILLPDEQAKKFAYLRWFEKTARQEAFLFGTGKDRGNNVRVKAEGDEAIDTLTYEEFSGLKPLKA